MYKRGYHVAIVSCVYAPEPVVSARISQDVADRLVALGHRVTVFCPYPSRPISVKYDLDRFRCSDEGTTHGLRICRLRSFRAPRSSVVPRMVESASFGLSVAVALARSIGRFDVVYANTWPLLSQAVLAHSCMAYDVPLVLHRQDIYPEALEVRLGQRWRPLMRALLNLDRWISRKVNMTVAVSAAMQDVYLHKRRVEARKSILIHNWQDEKMFSGYASRAEAASRYNVDAQKFTFLYLGNMGPVAALWQVIEAFAQSGMDHSQLVLAGDGSERSKYIALVEERGIKNVTFIADPDHRNVSAIQSLADVLLLPMRRHSGESSVPSKLSAYMLSAKPIIAAVDVGSETAHCVQSAECGWVGEAENVPWLSAAMQRVALLSSAQRSAIGERGRRYALEKFSKTQGAARLADAIISAIPVATERAVY